MGKENGNTENLGEVQVSRPASVQYNASAITLPTELSWIGIIQEQI